MATVRGQAIDCRRAKTLGIGCPIERTIADGERFDIDATVGLHTEVGVDTSAHVVVVVGIGTARSCASYKGGIGAVELGAHNQRVVEDGNTRPAIKPIAPLGEIEQMVGAVDLHIADLLILVVAADKAQIIGYAVDHRRLAAIEIRPPQFVTLAPVEFVADWIHGNLQRFGRIDGQPADQGFDTRSIQIGTQHLARLSIITLFHLTPVEFAAAFIHCNVGDNLPWSLDDLHAILRVAQHGAFDGVGQAAIGVECVGLGADIGDGLRRAHGTTVTQFITSAGRHGVGLEARFDTLPVDAHQLVAGTGKGELGGVEVVA